jgi:hypothetical protein
LKKDKIAYIADLSIAFEEKGTRKSMGLDNSFQEIVFIIKTPSTAS